MQNPDIRFNRRISALYAKFYRSRNMVPPGVTRIQEWNEYDMESLLREKNIEIEEYTICN